jgi:ssDNA-binding Zn-finger/Zn-ribbon topoisomerase 1
MNDQILTGLVCGLIGGLSVFFLGLFMPAKKCPNCGNKLPKLSFGKRICPQCHSELGRFGK